MLPTLQANAVEIRPGFMD